jgi:16S rRNA (guanine527-N7)-methyltransferase
VSDTADVRRMLRLAQHLGFLGPAPVELHARHALGFLRVLGQAPLGSLLDLGSGGGVPGLFLAVMLLETQVVLLDSNLRRTDFLAQTVADLGLSGRVTVLRGRAEDLAREQEWREVTDVVVARAFGPPASTAECGSALVRPGGMIIVSDPPTTSANAGTRGSEEAKPDRWPVDGLASLGLAPRAGAVEEGFSFEVLDKIAPCPSRYPRRNGLPRRRPLF